jgi:hypothetical protein
VSATTNAVDSFGLTSCVDPTDLTFQVVNATP